MKCEKCGKEANFYYKSNINGKVTTMNLCSECAEKMGGENGMTSFDSMFDSMFDNIFGGSLFGGNMFGNSLFGSMLSPMRMSPWSSFGFDRSMLMPKIHVMIEPMTSVSTENKTGAAETKPETKIDPKIDPEMSKRRELNMLREQMKNAVEKEEFEKAAQLRDKIRQLDGK